MAWILLNARRAELTRSINDLTYQKLKLQREIRNLTAFSNAIADGNVTPDELSSLSSHFLSQGLELNDTTFGYASDASREMAGHYIDQYSGLTEDEYFQNSTLMNKVNLYWNDEGQLDEEQIGADLLEQYMKEYVQKYVEPELKAYEDEYEEEKLNIETQVEAMETEYNQLGEKISSEIQQDTVKL